MSKLRLALIPALFLAAGVALAHGPEDHGSQGAKAFAEPGDAQADAHVIEMSMTEGDGKMLFAPNVVTVSKGEQVRFHLNNEGELEHEFIIGTAEEITEHAEMMKAMPDMKHDDPLAQRFAPKARGSIVLRFTEAGEFEFACLVPGHREAGMTGKIVVK